MIRKADIIPDKQFRVGKKTISLLVQQFGPVRFYYCIETLDLVSMVQTNLCHTCTIVIENIQ